MEEMGSLALLGIRDTVPLFVAMVLLLVPFYLQDRQALWTGSEAGARKA